MRRSTLSKRSSNQPAQPPAGTASAEPSVFLNWPFRNRPIDRAGGSMEDRTQRGRPSTSHGSRRPTQQGAGRPAMMDPISPPGHVAQPNRLPRTWPGNRRSRNTQSKIGIGMASHACHAFLPSNRDFTRRQSHVPDLASPEHHQARYPRAGRPRPADIGARSCSIEHHAIRHHRHIAEPCRPCQGQGQSLAARQQQHGQPDRQQLGLEAARTWAPG